MGRVIYAAPLQCKLLRVVIIISKEGNSSNCVIIIATAAVFYFYFSFFFFGIKKKRDKIPALYLCLLLKIEAVVSFLDRDGS